MKLSWGTGILLAILAFVGFIMYFFVITLVFLKKAKLELQSIYKLIIEESPHKSEPMLAMVNIVLRGNSQS